jgi:hypothetical protein
MTRYLGRAALLALLALPLELAQPPSATAQYFGRQKVQYDDFDWRVMHSDRFDIHFYPEERTATEDAARMAERWYLRLANAFQHGFDTKPLIFYADHPDFQQTNVIQGMLGEGTGGVTEALKNRVIMPYTGRYAENDHVLGHELVHVFQYDLAQAPGGGGLTGMSRLPLWLVEGMAEYLSVGREDTHTAMWLRDATLNGELPTIDQLCCDPRFFPYRYGQALWAYIGGRFGDRTVPELYRFALRFGWDEAVERVLGISNDQLSTDWQTAVRSTYLPVIQGRQRPEDAGDPILVEDDDAAMHLAPSISPDGRWIAYYGRRDIFTVELYLADARTGEVVERLTRSTGSDHYDALAFISSAGAWSPDGTKFAFIVFEQGDNRIKILDVASRKVERTIELAQVGAIQHPAWSPDGRTLAFSGLSGGLSDLYLLDLPSGDLRQLTDDRYADLEPAWSPDGGTLVFVTDRGPRTDFESLTYGKMRLATFDVASGQTRLLDVFEGVKHINPQYSPDGRSIYFVSDREGFSDLYRLELATGAAFQITRLATGVSGITSVSPAMTVAAADGRVVFSVFEGGGYNVYALPAERAVGERVSDAAAGPVVAGILPPVDAVGAGLVASYLNQPREGLPAADVQYAVSDYSAGLQLDFLGPPSVGIGVSTFGTGLVGGVSAYFSDMMGNHQLATAVQAQGTLKDVGAQVAYFNAERRFNWGANLAHIPYLSGRAGFAREDGQLLYVEELQRTFVDQASLGAQYPLSTTRRFELNGGFTRLSFDTERRLIPIDDAGRQVGEEERISVPSPGGVNLFNAAAAFVGDNSFFGFTSPVAGQRYRFEVSPTLGDLTYTSALADYRRYVFRAPFTLAFRGLHYGRYGDDAEAGVREGVQLLRPLFLGYETFLRGYDWESFETAECTQVAEASACPEFDRLLGSRIGVVNLELRIPVLGVEEFGLINFPYLPLEVSPFVDAGVAWTSDESPVFEFSRNTTERVPVVSTGVSARVNLLGYMVIETYYAYPFQRPEKGWHFGFNLAPGW